MIRDITIKAALNGWIVKVGCQTVVFTSKPEMLQEIGQYLADPEGMEKKYKDAVNAQHCWQEGEAREGIDVPHPQPSNTTAEVQFSPNNIDINAVEA